jgi:hypothetical protein
MHPLRNSAPIPLWADLPAETQKNFNSIGLTRSIYDGHESSHAINELRRIAILNLYSKLQAVKLSNKTAWNFIREFRHIGIGTFDFTVTSLADFKDSLTKESTFTNPAISNDVWNSRELCLKYSLHFRHHMKYHDSPEVISVHIDPIGLYTGPGRWRKLQALVTGPVHLLCYHHYQRVENIYNGLNKRG